jgi:hypothetical protein
VLGQPLDYGTVVDASEYQKDSFYAAEVHTHLVGLRSIRLTGPVAKPRAEMRLTGTKRSSVSFNPRIMGMR